MKALLASRNPGKALEISAILHAAGVEVVQAPVSWESPEETGLTYADNALLKASSLMDHTGLAAIADDSGIEVDALDGRPGVRSARFAGENATDEQNLQKLIEMIEGTEVRGARYRCVAVFLEPGLPPIQTEGVIEGQLIAERRGSGGFGYDPIFVADAQTRTMAELTSEEKDAISHRGQAFRALADAIRAR